MAMFKPYAKTFNSRFSHDLRTLYHITKAVMHQRLEWSPTIFVRSTFFHFFCRGMNTIFFSAFKIV